MNFLGHLFPCTSFSFHILCISAARVLQEVSAFFFVCSHTNSSLQRTVDHHKYRVDDEARVGSDSILRHPALETRVAALLSPGYCVGSFVEEGVDCIGLFDQTNFFSDECKKEKECQKKKVEKKKKA